MSETPVFSKTKSLNHQNHQPAIIIINTLTGYIINLYIYILYLYIINKTAGISGKITSILWVANQPKEGSFWIHHGRYDWDDEK